MERQVNTDISAKLQQALAAHRQGRFADAKAGYEAVLCLQPRHFEALHMLGIVACETGETQKGIDFLLRAIALDPGHAAAHCNIANAYKALGWMDKALTSYERAIEIKPEFAEAYYNRGNVMKDLGRLEEALGSYDAAMALKPDLAEIYANRGIVLRELGRLHEALASQDRAVQLRPTHAPAHSNRGNALLALGRLEDALRSYDRAIALRPNFAPAYINQGNALVALGRFEQALASFMQAFRLDADLVEGLKFFSELLRLVEVPSASDEIRRLIIRCLESSAIDSDAVAWASAALLMRDLQKPIADVARGSPSVSELDRLTGGLLIAHLAYCPIVDRQLERFLTAVREKLLLSPAGTSESVTEEDPESGFLIALARQGFLNEYLWHESVTEEREVTRLEQAIARSIANDRMPPIRDVLLLAAYRPLHQVREIRSWCMTTLQHFPPKLKAAFSYLVANPVKEAQLEAEIEILTPVEDAVSAVVKSQYEENPYPRWEFFTIVKRVRHTRQILEEIAPHRPQLDSITNAPRVLIAGCGSGRHPLSIALRLEGSDVLAIDLSRKSLAYAQRKAMEMNVTNTRFAQADILNLAVTGQRFDIIECCGVLHHMSDPGAGLTALLQMLNPGGYIKLGLYSRLARRHVLRLRELAAVARLPVTLQDIRLLRDALIDADTSEVRAIQNWHDFYSTSAVRDLLFHVHEHQFSVPQLNDLIRQARLQFLGFCFSNPKVKLAYALQFRDDPDCINLANWSQFETANPDTFASMYLFWCRKLAAS